MSARRIRIPLRGQQLVYLRDLLRELVSRDIKVQYKRSSLGILWSLINPLMQLLVFLFLFQLVLPIKIRNYSSFVFSGMLVWNWFQSSLFQAASAITSNRELIRRPGFPISILPTVTVTTHLIHFLLALPIMMLFLIFSGVGLKPTVMLLPVLMTLQFVLTLSLGYLVAAFNVAFRDTQHILGVFLQLLFYLTPIFYSADQVPVVYRPVYYVNPMVHLIEAYRAILIGGMPPNWVSLLVLSLFAIILLRIGYQVFMQMSYRFVEEL